MQCGLPGAQGGAPCILSPAHSPSYRLPSGKACVPQPARASALKPPSYRPPFSYRAEPALQNQPPYH